MGRRDWQAGCTLLGTAAGGGKALVVGGVELERKGNPWGSREPLRRRWDLGNSACVPSPSLAPAGREKGTPIFNTRFTVVVPLSPYNHPLRVQVSQSPAEAGDCGALSGETCQGSHCTCPCSRDGSLYKWGQWNPDPGRPNLQQRTPRCALPWLSDLSPFLPASWHPSIPAPGATVASVLRGSEHQAWSDLSE